MQPRITAAIPLAITAVALLIGVTIAPRAAAQPAPGTILLEDNFDDPSIGILPRGGYRDGEFALTRSAASTGVSVIRLPGTQTDTTLSVDVRLVGETEGRSVALACRRSTGSGTPTQYRFTMLPDLGRYALSRFDAGGNVTLTSGTSAAIRAGNESNHVELTCAGGTITVSVNGDQVTAAQDVTYAEGELSLGVSADTDQAAEARFDNLVLTAAEPLVVQAPAVGCLPAEQFAYHVHAHLMIFVDGKQILVPANTGIQRGCISFVHTHDTSGIIHIEAPEVRRFTLGDFFQVWGQPLEATRVLNRTLESPADITIHVDGELYLGVPQDITIGSHTRVVIQIGQPLIAPPVFSFPPAYTR